MRLSGWVQGVVLLISATFAPQAFRPVSTATTTGSCFLLYQIGAGEVRRNPAATCGTRVSPQSTFKIPHALAAVDAGVISEQESISYDGRPVDFDAWRRSHTLQTAMRYSVVWFFQEMARRLGPDRERAYLERFTYGNQDSSSGLTTFWLGGSLAISPEEQQRFLMKLYADQLPVGRAAADTVRRILVQPSGVVTNAFGEHPFAAPWPTGVVVSAKTGSGGVGDGRQVRWLVGHVRRGDRAWIFVSNVIGDARTPATAAVDLAERALVDERVLR
jgi:beta-lactamase class D